MSGLQRFFKRVLPAAWAESMEAESRTWIMRCQVCGHEQSVWEAGGIRWKAKGNPTRRVACPQCGRVTGHKVYRHEDGVKGLKH